jgi:hypothetical protein
VATGTDFLRDSLWSVCRRSFGQYFISSRRSVPRSFFDNAVVSSTGFGTFEPDIFTHKAPRRERKLPARRVGQAAVGFRRKDYWRILVTTPEPTVLPPSRMANRDTVFEGDRLTKFDFDSHVVARHAHLSSAEQALWCRSRRLCGSRTEDDSH